MKSFYVSGGAVCLIILSCLSENRIEQPSVISIEKYLIGSWGNERQDVLGEAAIYTLQERVIFNEEKNWSSEMLWLREEKQVGKDVEKGTYWLTADTLFRLVQSSTITWSGGEVKEDFIVSCNMDSLCLARISIKNDSTYLKPVIHYLRL